MTKTLEGLTSKWLEYKQLEAEANRKRLEVEQEICQLAKENIPAQGTATLGSIKITTGFDRKWDVEILTQIYKKTPPAFPFKIDWKEDRNKSKKLEVDKPEIMALFVPALTIREKKPAFAYAGDK